MSENIIKTTGQHVFRYLPPKYTEKGAPFLAENKEVEKNGVKVMHYQFLGEGYYFWDYNIKRAHKWGRDHYEGDYKILEIPLVLSGDNFLDLVGSRKDVEILLKFMKELKNFVPIDKFGAFMHGIQQMKKMNYNKWPYTIIRALNLKSNTKSIPFNHLKDSRLLLNPEVIICFYDTKDINLQNKKIIDKQERQWKQMK